MMKTAAALVLAAGLSTSLFAATPADQRAALQAARVEAKSGPNAKLGPVLNALYKAQSSSTSSALAQRSAVTAKTAAACGNCCTRRTGTSR
jgi:hypothetical protein